MKRDAGLKALGGGKRCVMLAVVALFCGGAEAQDIKVIRIEMPASVPEVIWEGEADGVYRVERSDDLNEGNWRQRAVVEGRAGELRWVDPEAAGERVFYRVQLPGMEVTGIEAPVVGPFGATWRIEAKRIPEGSFLELVDLGGVVVAQVALVADGPGSYLAEIPPLEPVEAGMVQARVVDAEGRPLAVIDQAVQVTASGRAADAPGWTPMLGKAAAQDHTASFSNKTSAISLPTAPDGDGLGGELLDDLGERVAAQDHNASRSNKTSAIIVPDFEFDPDDPLAEMAMQLRANTYNSSRSNKTEVVAAPDFGSGEATVSWASKKGYDYYQSASGMRAVGKKGYDYYKAQSDMAVALYPDAGSGGRFELEALPGELAFVEVDLEVPEQRCYPLAWVRTYRSKQALSTGHGGGWDHAYHIWMEPVGPITARGVPAAVRVHDGSGRTDLYLLAANGRYRADGLFREGQFASDGTFQLRFSDDTLWNFHVWNESPQRGKIAGVEDRHRNGLAFEYDDSGKLGKVSNQNGAYLQVTWDGERISTVADQTGRSVRYVYYSEADGDGTAGLLREVQNPLYQGQTNSGSNVLYEYGASGGSGGGGADGWPLPLVAIRDGAGRLVGAYTYADATDPSDPAYRTVARMNRFGMSGGGLPAAEAYVQIEALPAGQLPRGGYVVIFNDEEGRVSEFTYDAMHRMVRSREYNGFALPGTPVTTSSNRPAAPLRAGEPEFAEVNFSHNADHLVRLLRMPDGTELRFLRGREWQSPQQVNVRKRGETMVVALACTDGSRRTMEIDYHPRLGVNEDTARALGRVGALPHWLTPLPSPSLSVAGSPIPGLAPYLHTPHGPKGTKRESGGSGVGPILHVMIGSTVASVRNGDGQVWRGEFSESGDLLARYSPIQGYAERYEYNSFGQLTRHVLEDGARHEVTSFSFDPDNGRLLRTVTDPGEGDAYLNITTQFSYDELGRMAQVIDPDGHDWRFAWNARNQATRMESPVFGNDPVDAARIARTYHYDAAGRLARCDFEHRDPSGALNVDNPLFTSFYGYDQRGRLVHLANEARPVEMESHQLTLDGLDPAGFDLLQWRYSAAGYPVEVTLSAGPLVLMENFEYDARGRLYRCAVGAPGDPATPVWQFDYDLLGALTALTLLNHGFGPADEVNYQYTFTYDARHRLTSLGTPRGAQVDYAYGSNGFVTRTARDMRPDGEGMPANLLLGSSSHFDYALPDAGSALRELPWPVVPNVPLPPPVPYPLPQQLSLPGTTDVCYELKAGNALQQRVSDRRIDLIDRFVPGSDLPAVTETTIRVLSPAGLLLEQTDAAGARIAFSYDAAGRVVEFATPSVTYSYRYSAGGNNEYCGKTDHFIVAPDGDDWTDTPEETVASLYFAHDPFGRVISVRDGRNNETTFQMDSRGRPRTCTCPSGIVVRFDYDGSTDGQQWSRAMSYDPSGDGSNVLLGREYWRGGFLLRSDDALGFPTDYTFDHAGRLVSVQYPDGSEDFLEIQSPISRLKGTRKNGSIALITDTTGSMGGTLNAVRVSAEKDLLPVQDLLVTFDLLGRPVSAGEDDAAIFWEWDSTGALVREILAPGIIHRDIAARGRVGITYPNGTRIVEQRDPLGRVLRAWLMPQDPTGEPFLLAAFSYLGNRLHAQWQANGIITTYFHRGDSDWPVALGEEAGDISFDTLIGSQVHNSEGQLLRTTILRRAHFQERITAEYEAVSGSEFIRQTTIDYAPLVGDITSVTMTYTAPGLPPVVESSRQFTYDAAGRRLGESGSGALAGAYVLDNSLPAGDGRMGRYSSWPGGELNWNSLGHLSLLRHPSGDLAFAHDAAGQPRGIDDPSSGSHLIALNPDAIGRHHSQSTFAADPGTPPQQRFAFLDGQQILMEQDELGNLLDLYIHYNGRMVAQYNDLLGQWQFPVASHIHPLLKLPKFKSSFPMSHGNDAGSLSGGGKPGLYRPFGRLSGGGGRGFYAIPEIADELGIIVRLTDYDPFGLPQPLLPDGRPAPAGDDVGPIRWMAPEVLHHSVTPNAASPEPISILQSGASLYLPDAALMLGR